MYTYSIYIRIQFKILIIIILSHVKQSIERHRLYNFNIILYTLEVWPYV